MSETTSTPQPATAPVATTAPQQPAYVEPHRRRSRLTAVAAGVCIAAGVVFIVAVIFFTGFVLGAHSGGDRGHRGGGDREFPMMHRHGPPPMGPMRPGPRGGAERPEPGFGPGGSGVAPAAPSQPPTTSPPARP